MSLASWMKLSTSRRRHCHAVVFCLGSLAFASAAGSYKSPSLLQQQRQQASVTLPAKEEEDNSSNNNNNNPASLFPDVRPPTRKWTLSWSSLLWGRPAWPTQFERFQDELVAQNKYQALPDPAKVMIPSHAIAGALLKEHYIEAYRVFSKGSVMNDDTNMSTLQRTQQAAASDQPQVVALVRLGTRVDGHYGIVHGGIVAMLVDDVLGYGFYSIGWPAAFTANLSVNYRQPIPAGTILKIECYFQGQERRKLYWTIRVVDARKPSVLYVDATSLFVIPKQIYNQVMEKESKINKDQ